MRSPLTADETCDVVVIGSGIAGSFYGLRAQPPRPRRHRDRPRPDRQRHDRAHHRASRHRAGRFLRRADQGPRRETRRGSITTARSPRSTGSRRSAATKPCEADFRRLDGYLIPTEEGAVSDLQEEFEACRRSESRSNGPTALRFRASTAAAVCAFPTRAASIPPSISRGLPARSRGAAAVSTPRPSTSATRRRTDGWRSRPRRGR